MGFGRVSPSIGLPPPGKISADRLNSQVNRYQIVFGAGAPPKQRQNPRARQELAQPCALKNNSLGAPFVALKLSTASAFSPSQDHLTVIIFVLGGRPCHKKGRREGLGFGGYLSRLSLGGALPCGPEAVDCERFFSKCLSPLGQIISQVLGTRGQSGIQKSTLIFPGG